MQTINNKTKEENMASKTYLKKWALLNIVSILLLIITKIADSFTSWVSFMFVFFNVIILLIYLEDQKDTVSENVTLNKAVPKLNQILEVNKYPIHFILTNLESNAPGFTVIFELHSGLADWADVYFLDQDKNDEEEYEIKFSDGESYIVVEEAASEVENEEDDEKYFRIKEVVINRNLQFK